MKKTLVLSLAFMAIFCSVFAQTATVDSFYENSNYPGNLIQLTDEKGNSCGIILIHDEEKVVNIFYIPETKKEVRKGSKEEKKVLEIILKTYKKRFSQKVKIIKKLYENKKLKCIVLKKEGV